MIDPAKKEELLKITCNNILILEKKIVKMYEDKKEAPSLIIPKSLLGFTKGQAYQKFLFSIY